MGWDNTEMVANIVAGGNYGWPCWEGGKRTNGYSDMSQCQQLYATVTPHPMVWTYPHDGTGASVTGGVTYRGDAYPARYKGKTFIGDFARQTITTFGTDGVSLTSDPKQFAGGNKIGNPTAVTTCQNGDICWADIINSRIMHLRYSPANQPPISTFTYKVNTAKQKVAFDASESADPEGAELRYRWNFGDGGTARGVATSHTFEGRGPYKVVLTVTDVEGATDKTAINIYPRNAAPVIDLTTPTQSTFAVGDQLGLSARVTDAEDGALPASKIAWTSRMVHCSFGEECHSHPSSSGSGKAFSTVFPDHGDDTRLVITATSPPDSKGVVTTKSFVALPSLRTLFVDAPADVTATINGNVTNTESVVVNASVSISVPLSSPSGSFQRWNDGVTTARRDITMPSHNLTLTPLYG